MSLGFGKRLIAICCASTFLTIVLGVAALWSISNVCRDLGRVAEDGVGQLLSAGGMRLEAQEINADAKALQLIFAVQKLESGTSSGECSACHSMDAVEEVSGTLKKRVAKLRQDAQRISAQELAGEQRNALEKVDREAAAWIDSLQTLVKSAKSGDYDSAHQLLIEKLNPTAAHIQEAAATLVDHQTRSFSSIAEQRRADLKRDYQLTIGLLLLTALIQVSGIYLVQRTNRTLQSVASQIASTTGAVDDTAGQMASAGADLSNHAVEQAAALEQTSASGNEVAELADRASSRAQEAATLLERVDSSAVAADQSLGKLTIAVDATKAASTKVSKLAEAIEEIAVQTNLLALNAAVEAARAGTAGAGFAVVADEVRSLSIRCKEAATGAAELIEQSLRSAGEGSARVTDVESALAGVTKSLCDLKDLMQAVRTDSISQAESVREMAEAVASLQERTSRIAAAAEENAAAGSGLTAHSKDLDGAVQRLSAVLGVRRV